MALPPPTLLTPTPTTQPKLLLPLPLPLLPTTTTAAANTTLSRRTLFSYTASAAALCSTFVFLPPAALAAPDDEYTKDTSEIIGQVRSTINMDRADPNVATAVAGLREASNMWVAKYRREKELLGRASFRDMYSALNAVSGHYISFGPTVPIPSKRKVRILEEMESVEKALQRGR